ncbi:protein FAM8A1 [Drosophila innubila]|uniref:protein FAM8A1 n=1 Tax=Drosophila innubila TaxID=198719 RepID=UPI00148C8075|nr:protein FAM8A1 [Drosophila innubila]
MSEENTEEAVLKPEIVNDVRERKPKEINKDLTTKEAYFASLEEWAKQAALIQMFPNYLLANYNYPPVLQSPLPFATPPSIDHLQANRASHQHPIIPGQANNAPVIRPNFNRFRVLDEAQQQDIIQRLGGTQVVVAPFWKRAVAEAIDVFILFILKIIVTFSLFHVFDLDFDKDVMRKTLDDEDIFVSFLDISMDFITLSSDLLLIELLTKLIVCCYECLWTTFYNGATPGKSLMKIRILYVEAVVPLQAPVMPHFVFQPQREPLRALLYPAETPTLPRALMRALAKNLVMTLLFPICVVMIFFKNNRTAYDIITKTIVVETNVNPVPATGTGPQVPLQRPHQQ